PHALSAAARRGLDDDRKTDLVGKGEGFVHLLDRPGRAGHGRNAGFGGQPPGGGLVPHLTNLIPGRADERDIRRAAGVGKLRVLCQEAISRMNRVGAGDLSGGYEIGYPQIRVATGRRTDAHVVVGKANVQRLAIGLAVDGNGLDPQLAAGSDDPKGDLAAVGDQDLLKHAVGPEPAAASMASGPKSATWPLRP